MKIQKSVFFGCMFISFSVNGCTSAHSFAGEWDWNGAPSTRTFSVELEQQGSKVRGQYCAVAQNGNKTDCDDEKNPNIEGVVDGAGQSAIVNFSSFFGAQNGKASVKINNGRLLWHIITNPDGGEFYAPKDAVLDRH